MANPVLHGRGGEGRGRSNEGGTWRNQPPTTYHVRNVNMEMEEEIVITEVENLSSPDGAGNEEEPHS